MPELEAAPNEVHGHPCLFDCHDRTCDRSEPDAATGGRSQLGRIAASLRSLRPAPSPLQRQSAALARAFASKPSILFADEPTGNLDTRTGDHIINLLFELNREEGTTLVLVTHDQALAERCQRRLRLDGGALVQE